MKQNNNKVPVDHLDLMVTNDKLPEASATTTQTCVADNTGTHPIREPTSNPDPPVQSACPLVARGAPVRTLACHLAMFLVYPDPPSQCQPTRTMSVSTMNRYHVCGRNSINARAKCRLRFRQQPGTSFSWYLMIILLTCRIGTSSLHTGSCYTLREPRGNAREMRPSSNGGASS